MPNPITIHARTEWCPQCPTPQKLIRKDIDSVHALKYCAKCKRKFSFLRSDTPQGRSARTTAWRKRRAGEATAEPESNGVVE